MNAKNPAISVRDMVLTALFTAVLCVVAPFSISIGPIPLSFATLVIYLAAGSLGIKYGTLSVLLYVALGAIGIPVFSNFEGGFHKVIGVTGGYIVGYIPLALAVGVCVQFFKEKLLGYVLGMVIGTVLLYTLGTIWFMLQTGLSLGASLMLCVVPFLIGDCAKIIVACILAPQFRTALRRMSREPIER